MIVDMPSAMEREMERKTISSGQFETETVELQIKRGDRDTVFIQL